MVLAILNTLSLRKIFTSKTLYYITYFPAKEKTSLDRSAVEDYSKWARCRIFAFIGKNLLASSKKRFLAP